MNTEQFERDSEEADDEALIDETLKSRTGRTVTLQMLLAAGILEPGKDLISIDYLGQKFTADLLSDGKIRHFGTTYHTPSAWALSCKKMISDKKSGCGWASVKYKGRKLDAYKAIWVKKCQQHRDRDSTPTNSYEDEEDMKPIVEVQKKIYQHNVISNRNIEHDLNTLIDCVPFANVGKVQPFLISANNSALLMIDFHCHLSLREVCGYLGGDWDSGSNLLTIKRAYPCLSVNQDSDRAAECELNIQKAMIKDGMKLVGWYHSHPNFEVHPTLRDVDNQLDYQVQLKGNTEATYSPCIGFVCSPYDKKSPALDSKMIFYWVIPPHESKILEYGRPMLMQYNPMAEKKLPNDFQQSMQSAVEYYRSFRSLLDLNLIFKDKITYFDALKASMTSRFPQGENKEEFWNWLRDLLKIKRQPPTVEAKAIPEILTKKEENPIMRELIGQNNALPLEPLETVKQEDGFVKHEISDTESPPKIENLKPEEKAIEQV